MNVKKFTGKIIKKECLGGKVWLLRIDLGEKTDFVPGQYVSLKVSEDGLRRFYSVASLPGTIFIDLVVDVTPMGLGSKYILSLREGEAVEIIGFMGKFTIDKEKIGQGGVLLIGTGVGVVPLKILIEDLLWKQEYEGEVKLIWGMRYEKDLYWQAELGEWQKKYKNFNYETVLSKPETAWSGKRGHVDSVVVGLECNWSELTGYLCGNPEMIKTMREMLVNKGVPKDKIFYEQFA